LHAFPKSVRLRQAPEFRHAFEHGTKAVCPQLVLFLDQRAPGAAAAVEGPRLGLVVSKKVGGAVERNAVKRRLREAFRHLRPELAAAPALAAADLLIVARPAAVGADPAVLAGALRHCLNRLATR
jgi:ribonuclease P protein component